MAGSVRLAQLFHLLSTDCQHMAARKPRISPYSCGQVALPLHFAPQRAKTTGDAFMILNNRFFNGSDITTDNSGIDKIGLPMGSQEKSQDSCTAIRPGMYRHFKGKLYEVLALAPLVDSPHCYVVYRPHYGNRAWVLRPYAQFTEMVSRNGRTQPRFQWIGPSPIHDPSPRRRRILFRSKIILHIASRKGLSWIFGKHRSPNSERSGKSRYRPQNESRPVIGRFNRGAH